MGAYRKRKAVRLLNFYGDSINAQKLYTKDAEEFTLTRYPKLHIQILLWWMHCSGKACNWLPWPDRI